MLNFVLIALVVSLSFADHVQAQPSTFQNLNFESAQISPSGSSDIDAQKALPGWGVTHDAVFSTEVVLYDTETIDASGVSLHDSLSPYLPPLSGNYSVLLQGGNVPGRTASITQNATVSINARSLFFAWSGPAIGLTLSLDGQSLSYFQISSSPKYTTYAADVSSFAGKPSSLAFIAPFHVQGALDDIRFSVTVVPEPSANALLALGFIGLVFVSDRQRPFGGAEIDP